jgi:magnesium transporter
LLTGWYGMNFKYMPELNYKWSYPVVIAVSLAIALGCLAYFKKKKWM